MSEDKILKELQEINKRLKSLENNVNKKLGLRDQYLQLLMSIHDEFKTLCAKTFLQKKC